MTLFLTACGWHFKNNEMLPTSLRVLAFESADEHSDMSRYLRNQLRLNQVKLVPAQAEIARLRLVGASTQTKVLSVFKHAREAEKLLTVNVDAMVTVPNRGDYPLTVSVRRTFFSDARAAVAKSAEQEAIMKEMYEQASRQLVVKMASLYKTLNVMK